MKDFLLSGPLAPVFRFIFLNILRLVQDGMIFKPAKPETGTIEPLLHPSAYKKYHLAGVEELHLRTNDGVKLTVWYREAAENQPTFLYLPGNTGHFGDCGCGLSDDGTILETGRDYRLALIEEIVKNGRGIMAICYRGFGTSTGKPSEAGLVEDTKTAWQFLMDNEVNPRNIIVYGDSLGGGVAFSFVVTVENQQRPAVVITTGTFASIAHKAHDMYPQIPLESFRTYIKHNFDSASNIKKIMNSKIVLMHGTKDETTYPYHSEFLVNSAREANIDAEHIAVQGAGHIDIHPNEIVTTALNIYEKTRPV